MYIFLFVIFTYIFCCRFSKFFCLIYLFKWTMFLFDINLTDYNCCLFLQPHFLLQRYPPQLLQRPPQPQRSLQQPNHQQPQRERLPAQEVQPQLTDQIIYRGIVKESSEEILSGLKLNQVRSKVWPVLILNKVGIHDNISFNYVQCGDRHTIT